MNSIDASKLPVLESIASILNKKFHININEEYDLESFNNCQFFTGQEQFSSLLEEDFKGRLSACSSFAYIAQPHFGILVKTPNGKNIFFSPISKFVKLLKVI